MQTKVSLLACVKVLDAPKGIVQAFVNATGNRDSDGDVVVAGAHAYGLDFLTAQGLKPKGIWSHEWRTPIAKTLDAAERMSGDKSLPEKMLKADVGALDVTMQCNLKTQAGRDAFENITFYEDEQQWSVGYDIHESFRSIPGQGMPPAMGTAMARLPLRVQKALKALNEDDEPTRFITKWVCYEYSPVLFGANFLAGTGSVKDASAAPSLGAIVEQMERIAVRLDSLDIDEDLKTALREHDDEANVYDGRVKDVEEAIGFLAADSDTKAHVERNESRIRAAASALGAIVGDAPAAKVYVPLTGSHEAERDAVQEAIVASLNPPPQVYVYVEAMFDDRAVFCVSSNGESDYFQVSYSIASDGSAMIGTPAPVEFSVNITPAEPKGLKMRVEGKDLLVFDDEADLAKWLLDLAELKAATHATAERCHCADLKGWDDLAQCVECRKSVLVDGVSLVTTSDFTFEKDKNHVFRPSSDDANVCDDCGAGRNRAWHDEDKTAEPVTADELASWSADLANV